MQSVDRNSIVVGFSRFNTKVITVKNVIPKSAHDLLGKIIKFIPVESNWPDTYQVSCSLINNVVRITIKRSDSQKGWGQNLKLITNIKLITNVIYLEFNRYNINDELLSNNVYLFIRKSPSNSKSLNYLENKFKNLYFYDISHIFNINYYVIAVSNREDIKYIIDSLLNVHQIKEKKEEEEEMVTNDNVIKVEIPDTQTQTPDIQDPVKDDINLTPGVEITISKSENNNIVIDESVSSNRNPEIKQLENVNNKDTQVTIEAANQNQLNNDIVQIKESDDIDQTQIGHNNNNDVVKIKDNDNKLEEGNHKIENVSKNNEDDDDDDDDDGETKEDRVLHTEKDDNVDINHQEIVITGEELGVNGVVNHVEDDGNIDNNDDVEVNNKQEDEEDNNEQEGDEQEVNVEEDGVGVDDTKGQEEEDGVEVDNKELGEEEKDNNKQEGDEQEINVEEEGVEVDDTKEQVEEDGVEVDDNEEEEEEEVEVDNNEEEVEVDDTKEQEEEDGVEVDDTKEQEEEDGIEVDDNDEEDEDEVEEGVELDDDKEQEGEEEDDNKELGEEEEGDNKEEEEDKVEDELEVDDNEEAKEEEEVEVDNNEQVEDEQEDDNNVEEDGVEVTGNEEAKVEGIENNEQDEDKEQEDKVEVDDKEQGEEEEVEEVDNSKGREDEHGNEEEIDGEVVENNEQDKDDDNDNEEDNNLHEEKEEVGENTDGNAGELENKQLENNNDTGEEIVDNEDDNKVETELENKQVVDEKRKDENNNDSKLTTDPSLDEVDQNANVSEISDDGNKLDNDTEPNNDIIGANNEDRKPELAEQTNGINIEGGKHVEVNDNVITENIIQNKPDPTPVKINNNISDSNKNINPSTNDNLNESSNPTPNPTPTPNATPHPNPLNNINNNQKEETMILKQKPIQYHKPCILLTTYNESSRTKMYEKRIEWWVENTKLPIYIVDSFNTGFDTLLEKYKSTNRLFCYKFDQKKFIRSRRFHQTKYEILSLKQAYEHFKSDWDKYTLIIKVTGKYVLPRFDTLIDEIPVENDFLVQYKHKIRWQNTEYLGFKLEKMLKILGELDDSMVFERTLRPLLDKYKTKRLGLIYIPKEYRTPTKQGFTYSSL